MDAKETDSMKLESEKLKAELNEQRKMVGRLQAQLQEATLGEIRLQKQKSETQSSLIQVSNDEKTSYSCLNLWLSLNLSLQTITISSTKCLSSDNRCPSLKTNMLS